MLSFEIVVIKTPFSSSSKLPLFCKATAISCIHALLMCTTQCVLVTVFTGFWSHVTYYIISLVMWTVVLLHNVVTPFYGCNYLCSYIIATTSIPTLLVKNSLLKRTTIWGPLCYSEHFIGLDSWRGVPLLNRSFEECVKCSMGAWHLVE